MGKERRNQIWHYRKRTPKRFRDIEPRAMIYLSLHTTSEALADQKIPDVEAGLFAFWEAKAAGKAKNAQASYDATVRLARSRGYRYVAAGDLASDLPELVRRMSRLMKEFPDPGNVPPEIANADLGGVERPKLMLSDLLEEFQDLTRDQVSGKSADQMRRWRNPRKKAIENLTRVIGDKPLLDITREDALEFRRWLWARIDREGLSPGSVNKDLTHISAMVRTVSDMKSLGIETPFNGLAFREKEKPRRRAFTVDWIRENLACADPLAEMNDEARDVLLAMVNTGCRPSEIIGLRNEHIRLDDNIPHIRIRADGRTIKTPHSARDIPLVGVSLDAMRRHPDGFPRYRGRDGWSNAVNKYMRQQGLLPGPGFSAYSLRHAFEDRLLAANKPDRLAADLMGHATQRPKYGEGASLDQKLEALVEISI